MKTNEKLTDSLLKEYHRQGTTPDAEFVDSVLQQIIQDENMGGKNKTSIEGGRERWIKRASIAAVITFLGYFGSTKRMEIQEEKYAMQPALRDGVSYEKVTVPSKEESLKDGEELDIQHSSSWKVPLEVTQGNRYGSLRDNQPLLAAKQDTSTFSIDVDTASYTQFRRAITGGYPVHADSVRLEEWINYFKYSYPQPDQAQPFSINVEASECPWNHEHKLVKIGLQGRAIKAEKRVPANLVFLVDTSGSMSAPDKLPLLQKSLIKLMRNMNEHDSISIVTYAGSSGVALAPTMPPVGNALTDLYCRSGQVGVGG